MNGLYVYGITDRSTRVAAKGVFGRPLRTIEAGGLHIVVETASRPPRPTVSNLKAQNRVLASLVNKGMDVLPARFGSFVAGRDELVSIIRERQRVLRRALKRIHGCVQMTLRVRVDAPSAGRARSNSRPGADYLRARAERASGRSHPLVRSIERAAAASTRASQIEWHTSPFHHLRVHHLVPRGGLELYRTTIVDALEKGNEHAILSGPWAPFAFVEIA